MLLRRLDKVDLNDSALISQLYLLFLGSPGNTPAKKKKAPASDTQRLLILDQFLKSKVACNSFPLTLQLIYECLFGMYSNCRMNNLAGVTTNVRIQISGLKFLDWVLRLGEDKQLGLMGTLLLSGLKKILAQNNLERT
jgi:proteasome component ECM29